MICRLCGIENHSVREVTILSALIKKEGKIYPEYKEKILCFNCRNAIIQKHIKEVKNG